MIYETARPHTAVLGQLPNTLVYRNVRQYPEARTHEGIIVFRVDARYAQNPRTTNLPKP